MKIFKEESITEFEAWSGAKDTQNTILENNKEDEFDALIEETYPEGIDETQLNDLLWFESEWIFECLGITEDEDEDDTEDEDTEDNDEA